MSSLKPLIPLLIAAGILLGGNGLQGTLIAVRGAHEGFSPAMIGFIGTAYFAGFLIGCVFITRLIRAVGHIRSFAALAATASVGALMLVLTLDPTMWAILRFVSGICFAGLFTVMESWLNSGASNDDRARVLALYRMIDIGAVTGMQFVIPALGVESFTVFAVMSMMITFSLVPVSIGDRSNPTPPEDVRLDLGRVWRISPLAASGCLAIGVTNSAFRTVGPVYASQIGLSVTEIAIFVSIGIIGGALIQYPLGYLSDRRDRRQVLLVTTGLAMATALAMVFFAGDDPARNFVLVFLFGAFAMPLFSLSAAHANDHAERSEFVLVTAGLMLFYSIGAIAGPVASSWAMEHFGPQALFGFNAAIYAIFILVTLYRMRVRPGVPVEERGRFAALLRTSPIFARLVGQNGNRAAQRPDTPSE